MIRIEWDFQCSVPEEFLQFMKLAADQALLTEGVTANCSVYVCMCDDEMIAEINQKHRGIAASTDVLSFPSAKYPAGKTAGQSPKSLRREYDDETDTCFLGDLFISVPHIFSQAEEYGHTPLREACYLLIHGMCHLMGYDHIQPEEKKRMRIMEEKILSAVSVTRTDNVTADDRTLLQLAREAMKQSYSPYSSYPVGAALHSTDGRVFLGCNVENASFGVSNCAERTAVFKAVSEGSRQFDVIAIAAKTKAWPCGACRQVLSEFAPDIRVLVTWEDQVEEKNLNELLPDSFNSKSMSK